MKNSFGNSVSITLFGESHGAAIGAVLDGLAPGIPVDEGFIAAQMQKRKGLAELSTKRREKDEVKILSGVFNGKTTGTPITFLLRITTKSPTIIAICAISPDLPMPITAPTASTTGLKITAAAGISPAG